jgi:hypothetical protein
MTLTSDQLDKMKQSVESKATTPLNSAPVFSATPVFEAPINLTKFEPSFNDLNGDGSPF